MFLLRSCKTNNIPNKNQKLKFIQEEKKLPDGTNGKKYMIKKSINK
jgi:hypothetical protein